ncbi:phage major capsid protein [Mycolicibacterium sphagni]|nr:phage major capsid protein [Mycolicibacterium sphagni]
MEEFLRTLIKRRGELAERRSGLQQKAESVLMVAREQGREALEGDEDAEVQRYLSEMRGLGKELEQLDARINEVGEEVRRSGEINANLARIRQTEHSVLQVKEQSTYMKGDNRRSYMQDLIRVSVNLDTTGEARDRLMRHGREVETTPAYAEYRALDTTDGTGGYAVPPVWLMDQFIELARPGRAFANLVQRQPLPSGTDSLNIPKLTGGSTVAVQNGDNTAPSETDMEDSFVNAPVRTIAGAQSLAVQLIDQSPVAFDDMVFRDLTAAHAGTTNSQVILGSGTAGQILGVHNTAGIGSVTPTADADALDATLVFRSIANAIQKVHTTRFLPPEVIVMHPTRWGWLTAQVDGQGRPLFPPTASNPQNASGILEAVASQQVVGTLQGLPVVTDPGIPTNLGGSGTVVGTEDAIYVARTSDLVLWESGIRARALPETKAGTLTVLLQIYSYLAFTAARYPQSVVEITGLPAITF